MQILLRPHENSGELLQAGQSEIAFFYISSGVAFWLLQFCSVYSNAGSDLQGKTT